MKGYRGLVILGVLVPQFGLGTAPGLEVKSSPCRGPAFRLTRLDAPDNLKKSNNDSALAPPPLCHRFGFLPGLRRLFLVSKGQPDGEANPGDHYRVCKHRNCVRECVRCLPLNDCGLI